MCKGDEKSEKTRPKKGIKTAFNSVEFILKDLNDAQQSSF